MREKSGVYEKQQEEEQMILFKEFAIQRVLQLANVTTDSATHLKNVLSLISLNGHRTERSKHEKCYLKAD